MTGPNLDPSPVPAIFDELTLGDRAVLQAMRRNGSFTVLGAHTRLVAADSVQDRIYRVRSGWLARTRRLSGGRRQIVSFLLPGDLVGLRAMLVRGRTDTVEALTAASVDSVDMAQFLELARTNRAIALRVMYQFGADEQRLHNWVTVLGQGSGAERIAVMLLDLRLRLRRLGLMPRNVFSLPLTHRDIADHVGIHVVQVNRAMKQLREQGLIALVSGNVAIHDLAGLERVARPMLDIIESKMVETPKTAG
jgi:CRP-like cAMP-binding protein